MSYRNPWEPYESRDYYPPERIQPKISAAYQATGLTDSFIVPALKSTFLGFSVGVLAGLLVGYFKWPPDLSPWLAWLIVWFAVMAISFWRFGERGQWLIERIAGADLNNDGWIGQPQFTQPMLPAPAEPLRVIVDQDQGRQRDIIDLPEGIDQDRLKTFARGLAGGQQFTLSVWGGPPPKIFSRSEFESLRETFIARGLATWKNPNSQNQGVVLTAAGRAVVKRIANDD